MWWCCGKIGPKSLGCKKTKHFSKEDDDEEELIQKNEKLKNIKRIRC
jgi:hypothetical protein